MIFISTGTTQNPFERMDNLVQRISKALPRTKIVYQSVTTKLTSTKNVTIHGQLPYPKIVFNIRNSSQVICHAGPATIFLSLVNNPKKPIVVPRVSRLGEHINDHQIHFAKYLEKNKLITLLPSENLEIYKIINSQSYHNYTSDSSHPKTLINNLKKYTKQLRSTQTKL